MENSFTVPPDYQQSFQRLLPYMAHGLRNDPQCLEAVVLYLKLGGEKLARIAIDAFNQSHRLQNAQLQRKRLEEALLADLEKLEEDEEVGEDEEDEETHNETPEPGDDDLPDY